MQGRADWDLVVVGAGPAGATAALAALQHSPHLRVALLDREAFPRDKCCGDGIAPHVLDVLAPLGAADVVTGWHPVERLDLAHGQEVVQGRMRRPVHVVPRTVFDARLVERATAAGATLLRHRVRAVASTPAATVLDGLLSATVVIGADGAHSVVRQALVRAGGRVSPKGARPRAVALRGYAPVSGRLAGRQLIRFGDRVQPAYAWSFDRGDGLANVGYGELATDGAPLTRQLMLGELERLVPGVVETGTDWRAHHLPLSSWRSGREQPDGPVLLTGDAAGLVNPMTGEGIYYAVATGALAGRVAAQALAREEPAEAGSQLRFAVGRLLGRHLRHTWAAGRLARMAPVIDAGIRSATHDPRVFDQLVELGLGDGRITRRLAGGLARELGGARGRR
ncbi:geranylgeranyl reductase family protein [Nocardioides jishulii]|uniref:Geranylgeranyl reductase family protein n=1 Tax=Nocardioides jishulii TaxID=2575440 RepID=A0A4U2YN99_9ACTN|nr:geranylgeranyl reductase family protein [Nocardioides jishulii]TKI62757.1 geranylgeranyl reductase family protein [Nocardioides jishulii]